MNNATRGAGGAAKSTSAAAPIAVPEGDFTVYEADVSHPHGYDDKSNLTDVTTSMLTKLLLRGATFVGHGDWGVTVRARSKAGASDDGIARTAFETRENWDGPPEFAGFEDGCDSLDGVSNLLHCDILFLCPEGTCNTEPAEEPCACASGHAVTVEKVRKVLEYDGNDAKISWEDDNFFFVASYGTS